MKPDIWMPIYIGDYIRDTQELTAEEHGVYFLLLMHYWLKDGKIGSDISRLSRVAKSSEETTRYVLENFFTMTDGNYRNKRADEEMEAAKARSEAARENVLKRWEKQGKDTPVIPPYNDRYTASDTESIRNGYSSSSSSPSSKDKEEEGEAASPVPTEPQPPARISPMKDDLANHWQEIVTAVQPASTWSNCGRERKALTTLASNTRTLFADVVGYGLETDLASDILREFLDMRETSRDKLIRGSPVIPSRVLQFWPDITTAMAERARAEEDLTRLENLEIF